MSDTNPPSPTPEDEKLDDSLEDTFPASDVPSQTDPTHTHKIPPGER
jgi:hypothetical protein